MRRHTVSDACAQAPGSLDHSAAERIVAWLRFALIPILVFGHTLPHGHHDETGVTAAAIAYGTFATAFLAFTYHYRCGRCVALVTTAVDVAGITAIAAFSGGPFSQARLAYMITPVAVAFRLGPRLTGLAGVVVVAAYLLQGVLSRAPAEPHETRFLLVNAVYIAWIAAAATAGSALLARRTSRLLGLMDDRSHLLSDALSSEERERRRISEGLHDSAIQQILSARHAIQEADADAPHPAHAIADGALARSVAELRDTIFELHPYVLEEIGLAAAIEAVARREAGRAGFLLDLRLAPVDAGERTDVVLGAAREFLANASRHAAATEVGVELGRANGSVRLCVSDDGSGFDPSVIADRVGQGHIGLAAQRARIEAAGGTLRLETGPGAGTRVTVSVPV